MGHLTFPKKESCDCQNLILREVERAGLVGLDGAIRMSGDPGSLLCKEKKKKRIQWSHVQKVK